MTGVGITDTGLVRVNNEDSIFVSNTQVSMLPNLYIVADGMGGHKAGNIASSYSIKFFCEYINNCYDNEILDIIVSAVKYSNDKVYSMSLDNDDYYNMGTTFLAAVINDGKLYIAHVGDCRLYIIRNERIYQITTDHTYVMEMVKAGEITYDEAKIHPKRNIITRALGIEIGITVDGLINDVLEGDIILICSDGLSNMLTDNEILQIVNNSETEIAQKSKELINTANNNGGRDNISVIVIG